MMKKTYLCDSSQTEVDPYKKELTGWGSRFNLGQTTFDRPSYLIKESYKQEPMALFEELANIFYPQLRGKWNELLEYEVEMSKKCTLQGGKVGYDDATKILSTYYDVPKGQKFNYTRVGRDALIKEIRARVKLVGLPQPVWSWMIRDSAGGLPTCAKKNFVIGNSAYYIAHVTGTAHRFGPLYSTLVACRIMRGKLRLVFMDATQNVDRIEPILAAVRNWFKTQYPELFAGLHNPKRYLWRKITRAFQKHYKNLETDFNAMDRWMCFKIAKFVLLPILNELLIPSDYLEAQIVIEAYFTQTVVFRNEYWEGEHTLFSGQVITQDLENFYDICLYLGIYLCLHYTWDEFVSLFSMVGDDVLAFFKQCDIDDALCLVEEETDLNKVLLSKEKTRKNTTAARFCRQTYSEHAALVLDENSELVIPAIATITLATLTILLPERINPNPAIEISACIVRCDNCRYHPLWRVWAEWIFSKLDITWLPNEEQFTYTQANFDWWTRVYGETYGLRDSPTYQLWLSLLKQREDAKRQ